MRVSKFIYFSILTILFIVHLLLDIVYNHTSWWWLALTVFCYITITTLGCIFIRWNFFIPSQNKMSSFKIKNDNGKINLDTNFKKVAITFDDGPAEQTNAMLDILKQEKITATFFLIGKNITGNNEHIVKRIFEEGHTIGNHSYHHGFNFDLQSAHNMAKEIEDTNDVIKSVTGIETKLFRPPYGVTNPNLAKAIRKTSMKSIGWSLRSLDTVAKDKNKLLDKILRKLKPGDIILLHDRCDITVNILPALIKGIRTKGFEITNLV